MDRREILRERRRQLNPRPGPHPKGAGPHKIYDYCSENFATSHGCKVYDYYSDNFATPHECETYDYYSENFATSPEHKICDYCGKH